LISERGARVIRGIISMGASTLIEMTFGFLSVTVAARVIPEERFGVYFLLLAMVYLLEVIGSFGLHLSAAKFVASASCNQERQFIVNNLLTFRLLTVIIISLLTIVAKPVLLFLFSSQLLSALFIYVPVLFAVRLTDWTFSYIMQGFQLYRGLALVQALSGVLNFGLVLLFLLVLNLDVQGLILATVLSLSVAALLRYLMIPTPKALAFDRDLIRQILRFGLPLQGNDVLTFVIQRIDILILGMLMSPASIAYLEVASKIPNYFQRLCKALDSVYLPHMSELFSEGRRNQAKDALNSFLRLTAFVTMFCALVFSLFQREVVVIIFSDRYLPSAPALGLLMMATSIGMVSTILDIALISADRPAYLLIINSVTTIASVLGNMAMIPLFGFMGAAYAKLIANTVSNPVSAWCVYREGIRVRVREYLKPALILTVCLLAYKGFGWNTTALKGVLVILFVVVSAVFSVVTSGDVLALLSSLRLSSRQPILEK
jgi:O-antigen/teichoic acid export membrane protein